MYPQLKATFNFRKSKSCKENNASKTQVIPVPSNNTSSSFSLKSNGSSGSASESTSSSASATSLETGLPPSILSPHQMSNKQSATTANNAIILSPASSSLCKTSAKSCQIITLSQPSVQQTQAAMSNNNVSNHLVRDHHHHHAVSRNRSSSKERKHLRTSSTPASTTTTTAASVSLVPKIVVAIHDFEPVNRDTDLPLHKAQEYEVISERIDGCLGWWRVKNRCGEIGLIPSNYVKEKRISSSNHHRIHSNTSNNSSGSGNKSKNNHGKSFSVNNSTSSSSTGSSSASPNNSSSATTTSSSLGSSYNSSMKQESLAQCHWFLPELDRDSAERLLKADGREGCFLVRYSTSQELYTISVLVKKHLHCEDIKHYLIRKSGSGSNHSYYLSETQRFHSIEQLIHFHRQEAGSLAIRLKHLPTLIHDSHENEDAVSKNNGHMSRLSLSKLYGDKSWEIRASELSLLEELGSGQFGVVRKGRWTRVVIQDDRKKTMTSEVAVKLMKEGTMSESDFVQEAKVMTKLRHPNLVMLFGLCIEHRPICIVTEFMKHGSLLSFLRNKANSLKSNVNQLISMCTQVCEGMAYLEANNYIHRDLAARNCLVGENHVVKVADFGLARLVADSNEYTSSSGTKFPIKWAPPEVLWFTKFSSKSDIWAFGVLMWEVMTCGQMPYGRCSNAQVVEMIRQGERLQRPRLCTTESFGVMESCWNELPEKRPTFAQLNHRLRMLLK